MSLFTSSNSRPRSLMETLLAKKIEAASQQTGPGGSRLIRTDSMDSSSSIGSQSSLILGDDVCRCDDCLLGIGDRHTIGPKEMASGSKKHLFGSTYDPRFKKLVELELCLGRHGCTSAI
uniref:Uncharacterized protein n=1 Tax=Anopheles epiroticus TaxID=199890 RepID=A0A182P4H2_9DIPT